MRQEVFLREVRTRVDKLAPSLTIVTMTIIDVHTHIFPPEVVAARETYMAADQWFAALYANPEARMATAQDLMDSMERAGVDRSVAFGFAFRDQGLCDHCNEYVLRVALDHPDRLIPFVVVNPCAGRKAVRALERALAGGARGVGELMPDGQGFALADAEDLAPILGLAREAGVPVMVHVNELVGHHYPGKGGQGPVDAYRLACRFPDNTFILGHWGGGLPFYELMPEVRDALANVYYDSAASLYLYCDAIFAHVTSVAPDKALFGSDYPLISQSRFLRRVRGAELPHNALERFLGANAADLLGLADDD